MRESESELRELQELIDTSLGGSSAHLRSIMKPGSTVVTAEEAVGLLTGMCVISVATVTAKGEPRISALDGFFLHGRWVFGTDGGSPKARQLKARPAISVSYVRGEELGIFAHGRAETLHPGDHPDWPETLEFLTDHYGESPLSWGDNIVYYRMQPHWMVTYGNRDKLFGSRSEG